nr:hypothetical protein [Janibacter limosus]
MREVGYDVGDGFVGMDPLPSVEGEAPDTTSGNALIHELIAAGGRDEEWLTRGAGRGRPGAHPRRPLPRVVRPLPGRPARGDDAALGRRTR